ncbi:hypothetical protein SGFS_065880 [Streptomyces graminofaciens]|uniref:Tail assembly chaperone n=1 Tax=Streptomyces graminofaciens TaxID=68212 RepID=A0ABM7FE07_9ACTN|nr:hypothetical protein [Streptomyces graminofaciens]BBC35294.1 hypothetical protein SGFS_065880 [Streptomyces graminofaciens]
MGYKPRRKIYTLAFEGEEYEGLEVKIRGLNTGQVMDIDAARADGGDSAIVAMLQLMAEQLVEWNVEDDEGQPVPTTFEGVRSLDIDFNWAVIDAWQNAAAGVPAPLESGSTSGEPSLVASIPTETLSLPPESTAVPA